MVSNNINPNHRLIFKGNEYQQFSANPQKPNNNLGANIPPQEPDSFTPLVDDSKDMPLIAGLTVPAWLGLSGLYALIMKANGGEYEKSFMGRVAKFGDRISETAFGKKIAGWLKPAGEKVKDTAMKSNVIKTMAETPSVAEWKMAKFGGAIEDVTGNFVSFVDNYIGAPGVMKKGAPEAEQLAKLAELGLKKEKYELIKANPEKYVDEIIKICKKNKGVTVKDGFLLKSKISMESIANRLTAMTKSSRLGRFFAKALNRTGFGLFVGGGIFMLMSAGAIAKAAISAKRTEKGDKFPTFMEQFLSNISWVITMPLTLKLMNAVGGLKYLGKSKKQVATIRKELKLFNEKAAVGFASKAEYKAAKAALDAAKSAGTKPGFWGKLISFPGKILTFGREVVKPYQKIKPTTFGEKFGNLMRKVPYFMRDKVAALAIGFGAYMVIFEPIINKLFVKISHGIFGKPKHSIYDEGTKEPQNVDNKQVIQPQSTQEVEHTSPTNLINMRQNGETYQDKTQTHNIANKEDFVQDKDGKVLEPKRTYIPSPQGVVLNKPDTSALDAAMLQADRAEKLALETLAMKF